MREILFRSKRKDNGEWITGNLLFYPDVNRAYMSLGVFKGGTFLEVQKDTLGQYTGLTDKNGKKIFEWDIIELTSNDYYGSKYKSKVVFRDGCFGIEVVVCDDITFFHRIGEVHHETDMGGTHAITYQYEVIGNIHDNPELLKDGGENND